MTSPHSSRAARVKRAGRTTRALHNDGRKLYADLSFGLVTDAAGAVVGAVPVGRGASERHLADKALCQRIAALEAKPAP